MENRTKILIGVGVVLLFGVATVLSITQRRDRGLEVRVEGIEKRDLVEIVTASGNIRARRAVDISSEVSARVEELLVDEGDDVVIGQTLLRLQPDELQASLSQSQASLAQANAQQAQQRANLIQAERDYDRLRQLRARDSILVSRQQLDDGETRVLVQDALLESAISGVSNARAGVEQAEERLAKTIFTAPMAGKVTRLNVEEGETVMIGTMNNPGSLVLTISDLSVIEVVLQVDETEVSAISLGDSASIRIDAFPDEEFAGFVTEIGNSAINPPSNQTGAQQSAIDFEVVLTLAPTETLLRPDLSATADIVVESRTDVVAVPIIALTVRDQEADSADGGAPRSARTPPEDVEGVFIVNEGTVEFVPVAIGIAGQEFFEILSGLNVGDTVVSGPYQMIRQLRDGDAIRVSEDVEADEGN